MAQPDQLSPKQSEKSREQIIVILSHLLCDPLLQQPQETDTLATLLVRVHLIERFINL